MSRKAPQEAPSMPRPPPPPPTISNGLNDRLAALEAEVKRMADMLEPIYNPTIDSYPPEWLAGKTGHIWLRGKWCRFIDGKVYE